MGQAYVETFFHKDSSTYSHVISDQATQACAIIDPVLDYDPKSGRTATEAADELIDYVRRTGLQVTWILETHVHADHLSAAPYIKQKLGGQIGIGSQISVVQKTFKGIFNAEAEFATDGRQFDRLFEEGDQFQIGELTGVAMYTPGHTPACTTYVVDNSHAFVGDTIFMPDMGTARCDFPGGDASTLFASIGRILSLPAETKLYMCHDYAPGGREHQYLTTVAAEREHNIHVNQAVSEQDFVAMRTQRDATLDMPVLILPSVQINMRGGELPPAESNGTRYLKIPLDVL